MCGWAVRLGHWYKESYDTKEMITEYSEWMRDNWNHPSVAIWDATNESFLPQFTRTIIPAVRDLDLSNRPWENSYNAPAGPDDPVEDHQYLFYGYGDERCDPWPASVPDDRPGGMVGPVEQRWYQQDRPRDDSE